MVRRRSRGFTLIEVVVAIALVGIGVSALLMGLAQGRRNIFLTRQWAEEESRATDILMNALEEWQQLKTDAARRQALVQRGTDPVLGTWEWHAEPEHRLEGRPVDLYRIRLAWRNADRTGEVGTHAVLRILP